MAAPAIITVMNGMLAALKAQAVQDGACYLKTCALYDGELDLDENLLREALRTPAMLVQWAGFEGERISTRSYRVTERFQTLVMNRNLRRSGAALLEPLGTARMIEDARIALVGNDLGLEMDPFGFPRGELLARGKDYSAYVLEFPAVIDYEISRQEGDGWLERIYVYHALGQITAEGVAELEEE